MEKDNIKDNTQNSVQDNAQKEAIHLVEKLEKDNRVGCVSDSRTEPQVEIIVDPVALSQELDEQGYGKFSDNHYKASNASVSSKSAFADPAIPMPGMSHTSGHTLADLVDESFNLAKSMEISVRGATALQKIDGKLNGSGLYLKIKRRIQEIKGEKEIQPSVYSLFEEQSMVVSRLASELSQRNVLLERTLDETTDYIKEISQELEHRTQNYQDLNESEVREKITLAEAALSKLNRGDPLYHRLNSQRLDLKSKLSKEERGMLLEEDMLEYKSKELNFVASLKESLDVQLDYSALLYQRQEQITETVLRIGKIFEVATDVNQVSERVLNELSMLTGHLKSYAHLVGKTAVYAGDVIVGEKVHGPITGKFADSIRPYVTDSVKLNQACKQRSKSNLQLWMSGSDFRESENENGNSNRYQR